MKMYRELTNAFKESCRITREDYLSAGIDRGLRKVDGQGILVGLTCVSDSFGMIDGAPCEGRITFRGYDLKELVSDQTVTYERIVWLLLTGRLPEAEEQCCFENMMAEIRERKWTFLSGLIKKLGNGLDIMNMTARCILGLYDDDPLADDTSIENAFRQVLEVVALTPIITTNLFKQRQNEGVFEPLFKNGAGTAENILWILRDGQDGSAIENGVLNKCLSLHAELGGGNNSAFTTRVVSSTGTDTYSALASAICSLKGPKHGGANIKVHAMFRDIKRNVANWRDEEEVSAYLLRIIRKETFDCAGLVYGIGHAVFTLSDPRAQVMKHYAKELADQAGRQEEFALYNLVERLTPELIRQEKGLIKPFCANVDYYSGFIYDLLGIPEELYTPMFVNARMIGWGIHRLEELTGGTRIMHPAFPYHAEMPN